MAKYRKVNLRSRTGYLLKMLRKKSAVSIKETSKLCGISETTIGRIEKGKSTIQQRTAESILRVYITKIGQERFILTILSYF